MTRFATPAAGVLIALLLGFTSTAAQSAALAECPAGTAPQVVQAQFTSAVKSRKPVDNLIALSPAAREVFLHVTTRGAGTIAYRWYRDGKRVNDVKSSVGDGEWHTWSRLRLSPPVPGELRVQVLAESGCVLREMTLATSVLVDHPAIGKALRQLAEGKAIDAKITLNELLESEPAKSPAARGAQRLLETEVAIAGAREYVKEDQLFLVEPALRAVEKKLGRSGADRAARERIADVRKAAMARQAVLEQDGAAVATAFRRVLATEKQFRGDFPLLRSDAEPVLAPLFAGVARDWTLIDWQPTLRGYRLVVQDNRTGKSMEIRPEN